MELTVARSLLSLNTSYQEWIIDEKKTKLARSHHLLSGFSAVYQEERSKLPFSMNLLHHLNINENAHSKFLIRILQHPPSLISFIDFLNETRDFHFDPKLIQKPVITAEKMRIDGLIREVGKYAIIIENKIHGAVEQHHQIARYIDVCKSLGFKANQIYVIYLTRYTGSEPTEQIWGTTYKQEDFHTRYIKISYKSEIIPWLEKHTATLPSKEELLKSALIQYADHIKSLVNIKKDRTAMNEELRHFLSNELGLSENQTQNIQILNEKITELNELSNQMQQLLLDSKRGAFLKWKEELGKQFNLEVFDQLNESLFKTGVKLNYNTKQFSVLIEYDLKSQAIYYGLGRHHIEGCEFLDPEIKAFLAPLKEAESLGEHDWWYGWTNTSFQDGYLKLQELIKLVMRHMEQSRGLEQSVPLNSVTAE